MKYIIGSVDCRFKHNKLTLLSYIDIYISYIGLFVVASSQSLKTVKIMSNPWKNGLCGCFGNVGMCVVTYFIPCYTAGKNAQGVGDNCLVCGLINIIYFPVGTVARMIVRGKIRAQRNIAGNTVSDFFLHLCCACCSLVQESSELASQQPTYEVTITTTSNMERH